MSAREVIRRVEAYAAGRPLPFGSTLHTPIAADEDILIVAFARMGGESLPWGLAFGRPDRAPTIMTVAEARERDLVAGMLADFTPVLLRHLGHPDTPSPLSSDMSPVEVPFRQLWVPNPSHLAMLHLLNARYTFARRGEAERVVVLNALGRACGWMFREAQRAGQAAVVDASDALRRAFTFPADDLRQQHLGFLLAWLQTRGARARRERSAEDAERMSVSITLDPTIERDELESVVDEYRDARSAADRDGMVAADATVRALLAPELERRFDLTRRAIALLRDDSRPQNPGLDGLKRTTARKLCGAYLRTEERLLGITEGNPFIPSPETDKNAKGAAAGYLTHVGAEEAFAAALLHHDRELQDDAIADGDAFRGTIVAVDDLNPTGAKRPHWTIDTPGGGPTRMRVGSSVCVAGLPQRDGKVRQIEEPAPGVRRLVIEIIHGKTRPRDPSYAWVTLAHDPALVGTDVTMLSAGAAGISERKRGRVWDGSGPGGWLTHRAAGPPSARSRKRRDVLADVAGLRGKQ